MKDRVPTYPGRVKLTPVSGQENVYDMERADEPTEEGTLLNKATFLKDQTAEMYGLDDTAVPDDVFQSIPVPLVRVTSVEGCVLTLTNGSATITKTVDSSGVCDLPAPSYGDWTLTATEGAESKSTTFTIDTSTIYKISLRGIGLYGVIWDGSSTTKLTRTDNAADFTDPVPYYSGLRLTAAVSTEAGMEKSSRTGGVMVSIPKFWYKLTQNGNGIKIQIADTAIDGFYVSPAHADRGDGSGERDVVYIARYHCGSSAYKSVSGQSPKVNITRSTARSAISALGTNIWQMDFAMRFTIWLLYIVEYADWNSQTTIGGGCSQTTSSSSAVFACGGTDSMPYHTGNMQSSHSAYGVCQYRYIEGLWDNCYDWMDGCYYSSSGMSIILNPASFSDSSGGTVIGTLTSGYPSALSVKEAADLQWFLPSTSSGSTTTYVPDYWNFHSSYPCLFVGGGYYQFLDHGLFCVYYYSASYSGSSIGCRLQEIP